MKGLKLLLLTMLISISAFSQTTPWTGTPSVTWQTRTYSGEKQIRALFGTSLISFMDSLHKFATKTQLKLAKDSLVSLYTTQTIMGDKTYTGITTYQNAIKIDGNGTDGSQGVRFKYTGGYDDLYYNPAYRNLTWNRDFNFNGTIFGLQSAIFNRASVDTPPVSATDVVRLVDLTTNPAIANTYTAKTPVYGTIYNKATPILADFTANGVTSSTVSGGIQITGSTADYQHSLDLTGYTLLDRWQKTVEFTAPTPDATTAIAIGTRSANTTAHFFNTAATVDLTNTATAGTVTINGGSGTAILATAPVKLVFAAGDKISITITRDFATFTVRVVNITTPMADVSATYTLTNFTTMQNTGTFSIFARSATPINVTKVSVFSKSQQNAIAVLGDSKGAGGTSTQWSNTMTGILQQNYPVVNVAGGSDATADILLHLPEVIALKPRVVLLVGPGRNDKSYGVSDATIMANIATIVNTFTTAGIPVYITTGFYETTIDMSTINASIKSTYPLIAIDTYAATAADLSSGDAIHQKDIGNAIAAKVVLESGIFSKLSSNRVVPNMQDFANQTGIVPNNGAIVYGNNGSLAQDSTSFAINPATKGVKIGGSYVANTQLSLNKAFAVALPATGIDINVTQASSTGTISGLNISARHTGATGNAAQGLNVITIKDGTGATPITGVSFTTNSGPRAASSTAITNIGLDVTTKGSSATNSTASNQTTTGARFTTTSTTATGETGVVNGIVSVATGLVGHAVVAGSFNATGGVTNDAIDLVSGSLRIRGTPSTLLKTDANGRVVTAVANTDYTNPAGLVTERTASGGLNNKILAPANTYQASTGTTNDSLRFASSQRMVEKALVAGAGLAITQTPTSVTFSDANGAVAVTRSAATTLTLAYGSDYVFTGTAAVYTLPAVSASNATRKDFITIKNAGTANITLNGTIYDGAAVTTITILPGSAITLVQDGTQFNKE